MAIILKIMKLHFQTFFIRNYETIISDKECLKVLSYYRIKREDAEKEIKGE